MIWLDFKGVDFTLEDLIEETTTRKVLVLRPRLVVHYRESRLLPCVVVRSRH